MTLLPYSISDIPGMRPATDPVLILFFLSPFVVAFVAAILYDVIEPALTVPNQVIISSSMYYPEGFYLAHILNGLAGYPLFGVLCAGIWSGGGLEDLRKEIRSI